MLCCEPSHQRFFQLRSFRLQLAPSEFGHQVNVRLPCYQGSENRSRTHSRDIRDNSGQLAVRILPTVLNAVDEACAFLYQARAGARQLAQLSLRTRWDETGQKLAMLEQISDPFRIFHIGFSPGDSLDVLGIDQPDFQIGFQQITTGFPLIGRTFHRHMRAASRFEPVQQPQQVDSHRTKRPDLFLDGTLRRQDAEAGHNKLFMDIDATTALIDNVHTLLLLGGFSHHKRPYHGAASDRKASPTCFPLGSDRW